MKTRPSIRLERMSFFASGWRAMLSLDLDIAIAIPIAPAAAAMPTAMAAAMAIIPCVLSAGGGVRRDIRASVRGLLGSVGCGVLRLLRFRSCYIVGENYAEHESECGERDDCHKYGGNDFYVKSFFHFRPLVQRFCYFLPACV